MPQSQGRAFLLDIVMKEIFKDIENYEGLYKVSNLGNVKTLRKRKGNTKLLSPNDIGNGYLRVSLYKNGNQKNIFVHRLVAKAFIANPENKPEVNHKDLNPKNNNLDNLEWVTRRENTIHFRKHHNFSVGETHGMSKLTEEQVIEMRDRHWAYNTSYKQLAEDYNISSVQVSNIIRRRAWDHVD